MRTGRLGAAALAVVTVSAVASAGGAADLEAQAAPKLDDATIVAIFDAANTADMETGRLAAERGQSQEVRDFGATLVRDHEAVRKLGRDLAAKLGVTPTPPADDPGAAAHAEALAKLEALSGPAFDRAFLEHEVAFHRSVVDAVQTTLLPAIQNAELKTLVEQVAPAFEAHMKEAERIRQHLGGASR